MDKKTTMALIKRLLAEHGWSKERLAAEVGVSLQTIYRWERGDVKPSQLAVNKLQELAG